MLFVYHTFLKVGWRWGPFFQIMPLIKVVEESLNKLIFKDIDLNLRSNGIYFLKTIGMSHSFPREETLLHLSKLGFA